MKMIGLKQKKNLFLINSRMTKIGKRSNMREKTAQEELWEGNFGDSYIERNNSQDLLASNVHFFAKILSKIHPISTCIEFGANIGLNLKAINILFPKIEMEAVEINESAVKKLADIVPNKNIFHKSIIDYTPVKKHDLVLVKGVLIHISPSDLDQVYQNIYNASSNYVLMCEYYNRTPVSLTYRGLEGMLFKRDFCSEFLTKFSDFQLVDYGFAYHRDPNCSQDDITWFLLKRVNK